MTSHLITGFRAAEAALKDPHLKQSLYDEGAILMERVLVTLHGNEHRARRGLEMGVFRRDFFRYYEQEVIAPIFEETIKPFVESGRADVTDFGYRVMVYLATAFAGIDHREKTEEELETLIRMLRVFGQAATLGQSKRSEAEQAELRVVIRNTIDEFDERFFTPAAQRRQALIDRCARGEIGEDELPRDVLTVLLRNEDRLELTRDMVLRETGFYFLAGAHTSVHSLGHAMHHLLTWCEEHPEDRAKLVADPTLVQTFVHESFRLHPSSPVSRRKAIGEVQFLSGETANEGDHVVISLQEANRDRDIFGADADLFNPYRELPTGISTTALTFGIGIHSCLGRALAAGVLPRPGETVEPERRQYGTVARAADGLLKHGAQKDPDRAPQLDPNIERETWMIYPIVFERPH